MKVSCNFNAEALKDLQKIQHINMMADTEKHRDKTDEIQTLEPGNICRIDQKTCIKCITAAALEVVVVNNVLQEDQLCTDLEQIGSKVGELGAENIVAVLSTTSCFAPRAGDDVIQIAKLCQSLNVGHIINNAYGVQARFCSEITVTMREVGQRLLLCL